MLHGMKTPGERLRFARKEAGLSQEKLASRIGMKQPTLSELERGESADSAYWTEIERETGFRAVWLKTGRGPQRVNELMNFPTGNELALAADLIQIRQLDVSASMGEGAYPPDHVDPVQVIQVRLPDLRRQVSFSAPDKLNIITGLGDSMEPTYKDGDILLIDTAVQQFEVDAVYVLYLNGKLYIKTIQRRPDGRFLMISDNRKYEPYLIGEGDVVQIQGRVLLAWNARRL